jgi:hypothetical protein
VIVARTAAGTSTIGAVSFRESGGVTEIGEVYIRDASGLKELFSPSEGGSGAFTVDVTPDSYGARVSEFAGGVTTSEVVATPVGGLAPYTYLWARVDANPEDWTIIASTAQATTFRAAAVGPGESFSASFTCTVTDANGNSVESGEVAATAVNYGTAP